MRSILLGIGLLVLLTATAAADRGKQVRYIGIHPIVKTHGGGFCHIEGPHVHIFPADKVQYRDHRGHQYFVGDPVAYGYDGPRVTYKGHHPIHVHAVVGADEPDVEYCYLDGPHFHYFAPPEGPEFKVVGDVHFYVAEPPKVYVEARPAMMQINAVYRPIEYARPVVTIDAPVGWVGARAEFITPVVVESPRGHVVAPAAGVHVDARVHIPVPSLRVEIGVPGVVVHERPPPVIIRKHGKHKHKKWKHKKWKRR